VCCYVVRNLKRCTSIGELETSNPRNASVFETGTWGHFAFGCKTSIVAVMTNGSDVRQRAEGEAEALRRQRESHVAAQLRLRCGRKIVMYQGQEVKNREKKMNTTQL
jgi:hypothetical protein